MRVKRFLGLSAIIGGVFVVGFISGNALPGVSAAKAEGARVYELRTYITNDGKLDDLHARFSNHTNRLFVKHGMTLIGYWTPESEGADNTLIYLLAHENRAAADASWAAFRDDPEWKEVVAKSHENGVIVKTITTQFLDPTNYSPLR